MKEQVGLSILKQLEANGIALPSSSALKGGKNADSVKVEDKNKSQIVR